MKRKISISEKKRKVAAIIFDKGRKYVGIAKCQEEDIFYSEVGINISVRIAKIKAYLGRSKDYMKQAEKMRKQADRYEKLAIESANKAKMIKDELNDYRDMLK